MTICLITSLDIKISKRGEINIAKYDYGRKYISKHTGLTGVESEHIIKQLRKQNLSYDLFDWKTIGDNLYGHGKRSTGVKKQLKSMYGVSFGVTESGISREIQRYSEVEVHDVMSELLAIHESRSPHARMMDYAFKAKHTFKPSNKRGVKLWKKNPNRYDIVGIDDLIG